jgi:hypothetical protein
MYNVHLVTYKPVLVAVLRSRIIFNAAPAPGKNLDAAPPRRLRVLLHVIASQLFENKQTSVGTTLLPEFSMIEMVVL